MIKISNTFAVGNFNLKQMNVKNGIVIFIVLLAMVVAVKGQNAVGQSAFCIAKDGRAAAIVADNEEWKSVVRAAYDLSDDIRKVAGVSATLQMRNGKGEMRNEGGSIVVGTIGKSRLIDRLIRQKKLDVGKVKGRWESFVIDVVMV